MRQPRRGLYDVPSQNVLKGEKALIIAPLIVIRNSFSSRTYYAEYNLALRMSLDIFDIILITTNNCV